MPQKEHHGDYEPEQQRWFCGYWMSHEEWLDVHDYSPAVHKGEDDNLDEE